jgi:hypothetical protein
MSDRCNSIRERQVETAFGFGPPRMPCVTLRNPE